MTDKVLLTPSDLSDMMASDNLVLIDTRVTRRAMRPRHLPGAVNIHDIFTYLATSTPEGVAAMREKFAAVFGAAGLSGEETAVVYEQSMNTGFRSVLPRLRSARPIWAIRRSRSCTAVSPPGQPPACPPPPQVPTPTPATFPLDPSAAGLLVDLAGMKAAVADPNIVKLDTRDVDEWIADSHPRPTARISARARAASRAPNGSSGTA